MKLLSLIAALILAGCQTTPTVDTADSNDVLLSICEHAVYTAASRAVTANPQARADWEERFDVLDYMLDGPVTRKQLCQAMGTIDMIAPEGGDVRVTATDVFISGRSISDEFVYPVANSFWVALNKFLHPTPKPEMRLIE